ncbi:MAG TPA: maltose ABC transporter substrate-binding protein, partial [Ilumatobacteraceae bacterium]|nr:maltose ABC transporter substrate-binding protein [Ilumatobacteraceae bacterium]
GSDDDEATTDTGDTDTTEQTETTDAPDTTEAPVTTEATTETTEYQPPARGDADLVIWADDTRTPVLEPIAASFSEAEGVNVQVLEVPFDEIRDNLSVQGPAGEGPDIIIGAHDWLGELVSNGVVEPLDLGPAASEYSEVAIEAFTYDGQTYGLPYAIENIALIRNVDLVPEAPATFEELEEIALGLQADGTVTVPLAVQQDPADPYHNYPLFTAMGGYVFAQDEDGSYNADDLGIDSEGGLAAAQKFAEWSEAGLISKDVSYAVMIDSFSSGQAPFAITGPWAVGEFGDVDFVVEPVPPVEGGTPNVFVGVQGFMISSFSENVDLAKTFLLDYLNTEEVQLALFDAGGRPPAMTSAFEQVASDPIIEGFGLSGQQGAPLPAIPEMSAVWESWTNAYNLVFTGTDPTTAFTDAATAIREAIAG